MPALIKPKALKDAFTDRAPHSSSEQHTIKTYYWCWLSQEKHKIWLYKDKATGQMKGDGTVTYEDPFSAGSAVQWFNGKDFKGEL